MVRNVKSHQVGQATLATGVTTSAYRAILALECAQCARTITPGTLFSRQTRRAPAHTLPAPQVLPICTRCRPLRLEDPGEGRS